MNTSTNQGQIHYDLGSMISFKKHLPIKLLIVFVSLLLINSCKENQVSDTGEDEAVFSIKIDIVEGHNYISKEAGEIIDVKVQVSVENGDNLSNTSITWNIPDSLGDLTEHDNVTNQDGFAKARWKLGATTEKQVLNVVIDDVEKNIHAYVVSSTVDFDDKTVIMWTGERKNIDDIKLDFFDINGVSLQSQPTWESVITHNRTVNVTDDNHLIGLRPGNGRVNISIKPDKDSEIPVDQIYSLDIDVKRKFTGQLISEQQIDFDNTYLLTVYEDEVDATSVEPDGSFIIRLDNITPTSIPGLVLTLVDDEGKKLPYHSIWIWGDEYDKAIENDLLTLVLIPSVWEIRRGIFQNEMIEISLNDAFSTPSYLPSFYGAIALQGSNDFFMSLQTAPPDFFPVKVGFWHSRSDTEITESDSLLFWEHLNDMEAYFGFEMFESITDPGWKPFNTDGISTFGYREIRVRVDYEWLTELGYAGLGGSSCRTGQIPGISVDWRLSEATTPWSFGTSSQIQISECVIHDGGITLKQINEHYRSVVLHEMMHALGLGHGCNFPSRQGRCPRVNTITKEDIAYWEILHFTQDFIRNHDAHGNMFRSLFGERASKGLQPVPDLHKAIDTTAKIASDVLEDRSTGIILIPD